MPVTAVNASRSRGDGTRCKLQPVKLNPRLDFGKSHSWCLFLLWASGTSFMSLFFQSEGGEERKGWDFCCWKCKHLRRIEEWTPLLCLQACRLPLQLRWLQADESLGAPSLQLATALKTLHCHTWRKHVSLQKPCSTFFRSNVIVSRAGKKTELN